MRIDGITENLRLSRLSPIWEYLLIQPEMKKLKFMRVQYFKCAFLILILLLSRKLPFRYI